MKKALAKQEELPSGDRRVGPNSLGISKGNPTAGLSGKADVFTVKEFLLDQFKSRIFEGIDEQLYQDMVVNSSHDTTP